jgi:hypothetical protein
MIHSLFPNLAAPTGSVTSLEEEGSALRVCLPGPYTLKRAPLEPVLRHHTIVMVRDIYRRALSPYRSVPRKLGDIVGTNLRLDDNCQSGAEVSDLDSLMNR